MVTCARRAGRGLPYEIPLLRRARRRRSVDRAHRRRSWSGTAASTWWSTTRAARRTCSPPDASAKFSRKIIELNLLGPLSVSTAREHRDADTGAAAGRSSTSPASAAGGRRRAQRLRCAPRRASKASPARWRSSGRRRCRVNSVVVGMVETEQSELFYGDADSIAAISDERAARQARQARRRRLGRSLPGVGRRRRTSAVRRLEVHGGGEPPHYLATTNANQAKETYGYGICSTAAWSS